MAASCELAERDGAYETYEHGLRNSLLVAPMSTASTAQILTNAEVFEPFTSNVYTRRVLAGEFAVVNKHLVRELSALGMWTPKMRADIIAQNGSVQALADVPAELKAIFKCAFEMLVILVIGQPLVRAHCSIARACRPVPLTSVGVRPLQHVKGPIDGHCQMDKAEPAPIRARSAISSAIAQARASLHQPSRPFTPADSGRHLFNLPADASGSIGYGGGPALARPGSSYAISAGQFSSRPGVARLPLRGVACAERGAAANALPPHPPRYPPLYSSADGRGGALGGNKGGGAGAAGPPLRHGSSLISGGAEARGGSYGSSGYRGSISCNSYAHGHRADVLFLNVLTGRMAERDIAKDNSIDDLDTEQRKLWLVVERAVSALLPTGEALRGSAADEEPVPVGTVSVCSEKVTASIRVFLNA
ncbi:ribonucleotide reductase [Pavlovales sp. CCMP2436]|nr:ribonucleotide reductase [Pavlovales sp. CCMP2436]